MLTEIRDESGVGSRIAPLQMRELPLGVCQPVRRKLERHSDEQLQEFVDAFLHDTNGSLYVAAEFSELLAEGTEGDLNPEQQRLLQVIHDRTYTVHDILESLHCAVKLHAGGLDFMPQPCSVKTLLDLTVPRLLRRARSRVGEFHASVHGSPPVMRCDPHVASLILLNLFFHVSRDLDVSHSLALQIAPLPGAGHNACRFIVGSGEPASVPPESCTEVEAYFELAAAMADETNCFVLGPDADYGQVAGLAIPTGEPDNDFKEHWRRT
jgi:hypothetical protein